jgi:dTDP-glucose 4,6-dehydratase
MIYGHTVVYPMTEEHPVAPLGEYGLSKWKTEELAADWARAGHEHLAVPPAPDHRTRPSRHPGEAVQADRLEPAGAHDRLGARTRTSSSRCSTAPKRARLAWKAGVPNEAYNLGSLNPPPVRKLLGDLIKHAGSKSILIPTPGWAVKRNARPARLDEHADHGSGAISDRRRGLPARRVEGQGATSAGCRNTATRDMLMAAYREYRAKKDGAARRSRALRAGGIIRKRGGI